MGGKNYKVYYFALAYSFFKLSNLLQIGSSLPLYNNWLQ